MDRLGETAMKLAKANTFYLRYKINIAYNFVCFFPNLNACTHIFNYCIWKSGVVKHIFKNGDSFRNLFCYDKWYIWDGHL
jgi:hypothetical protein